MIRFTEAREMLRDIAVSQEPPGLFDCEVVVQNKSLFATSRQIWKLVVGLIFLFGGGATSTVVTFLLSKPHGAFVISEGVYNLRAVSTALALLGFVYLCTQVRCPRCRAKWIWMGVSGKLNPKSLETLVTLELCPKCGYPGSNPRTPKP